MSVELYALMLLVFRFFTMKWMLADVIRKQIILRRRPITNVKAGNLREKMYILAWVSFAMNIVPATIDVLTLFGITQRPPIINFWSVIYMLSFSLGCLTISYIIKLVYRDALSREYEVAENE